MTDGNNSPDAKVVFEVSWEVCNKVGGIYTVVTSKVDEMIKAYGKGYYVVGPYFPDKLKGEFIEEAHPEVCDQACKELKDVGIIVHFGRWITGNKPSALLIDFHPVLQHINDIKKELWEKFQIDTLNSPFDFDEPTAFGWAAGMVIEKFKSVFPDKKIVAHVHEWIAGSSLLYLKSRQSGIGTVFTTHATVLGRCLANSGTDIYSRDQDGKCALEKIDPDELACAHLVPAKHHMEKACAHNADMFTTVSEITAIEAEHILKKKPDMILPNGIDISRFPSREECSLQHKNFRDKIYMFLTSYFFPYYPIDFDHTHIFFIAARYEFHDKGIDIFLKALAKLNEELKSSKSKETVVAFLWIPAGIRGIKTEIIENQAYFNDIVEDMDDRTTYIRRKFIASIVAEKGMTADEIIPKELKEEIYPKILRFKRSEENAPICTHDLHDDNDIIIRTINELGLANTEKDPVKVIFYPIYLTGADNLLNLDYFQAMQGSHFGVFPSFYEPYGYTPLECAALSIVSLTSDTSGFGQFIKKQPQSHTTKGIHILKRLGRPEEKIVGDLVKIFEQYLKMPKNLRVESKFEARRLAELSDWKILIKNYIESHNKTLSKNDDHADDNSEKKEDKR